MIYYCLQFTFETLIYNYNALDNMDIGYLLW